jgi:hypothetical protein
MRFSPTLASIVLAGTIFILAPYTPTAVLKPLVGTRIGSAILLIGVLAVLQVDRVIALGAAMAAAALFLEYRRRVVSSLPVGDYARVPIKKAPNLVPHEEHPPFETPAVEEVDAKPDSDTNDVTDLDQKAPLDTVDSQPSHVGEMLERAGLV